MAYCKANSCYDSTNYSWEDYCSYHEKCLQRLRRTYSSSFRNVEALDTFETWFNKNCGWVVTYDYSSSSSYPYYVWIVIYEPSHRSISDSISAIKYDNYSLLSSAKSKAEYLKDKLKSSDGWYDTPMLEVHPKANSYGYFSSLIASPYVIKRSVPQKWEQRHGPFLAPGYLDVKVPVDNINDYAKVFDVLKVCANSYEHVGVYVGNGEVCHFSKDRNGTYVDSWEDFKKFDGCDGNIDSSEATVYHPTIPFKYLRRIAEQVAWAVDRNFWRNNYDLRNRNCEHFANMCVYGINYSEQIYEKRDSLSFLAGAQSAGMGAVGGAIAGTSIFFAPFTFGLSLIPGAIGTAAAVAKAVDSGEKIDMLNNNKGSTIKLTNEMSESNGKLGERDDWLSDQIKANIEVPTKEYCKIM